MTAEPVWWEGIDRMGGVRNGYTPSPLLGDAVERAFSQGFRSLNAWALIPGTHRPDRGRLLAHIGPDDSGRRVWWVNTKDPEMSTGGHGPVRGSAGPGRRPANTTATADRGAARVGDAVNPALLLAGLAYVAAAVSPLRVVVFAAYLLFVFWVGPALWALITDPETWSAGYGRVDQSHTVRLIEPGERNQ